MKHRVTLLLFAIVIISSGCSLTRPKILSSKSSVRAGYDFSGMDLIGIVDVVGVVKNESIKNQIADMFSMQLLQKGYAPVQRELVIHKLFEIGFDGDGLTPDVFAIEAGRTIQVPAVLIVSVTNLGEEISINAKILDVDTGSAIWQGRAFNEHKTETDSDDLDDPFKNLGSAMDFNLGFQKEQPRMTQEDAPLSVSEEKKVEAVIERICKSLPKQSQTRPKDEDRARLLF